jgi:hypothetical protein
MANILGDYLDMLALPMRGLSIDRSDVASKITKGIRNPIGSADIKRVYGSSDDFMKRYQNLEDVYKVFLAQEMPENISVAQKRMLDAAQSSPVMNFSLIKNMANRSELKRMLTDDILNMEGLLRRVGPPSTPLPSSNLITGAARYGIDTRNANHYAANLLNSLTISIDPTKEGARAFGFGTSGLPSSTTLENMGKSKQMLADIVASGRNAKVLTLDTETSGLGAFSEVRSLAATEMEVGRFGAGNSNPVLSAHFSTREMQMITVPEAGGGTTNLAKAAFDYEGSIDALPVNLRDLLTPEGRLAAVDDYKNIFRSMVDNDFVLFHNAKFDIEKISTSVFSLGDDFFRDAEAANLFEGFQGMIKQRKGNQ